MATKQRVDIDVVVKNQQRIDRLEASLGRTAKGASSLGTAARVAAGAIAAIGVGKGIQSLVRVGQEAKIRGGKSGQVGEGPGDRKRNEEQRAEMFRQEKESIQQELKVVRACS